MLGQVFAVRGTNDGKLSTSRSWSTGPELAGGGALVDHVVHGADLLDAWLGAEPVSVTAVTNRVGNAAGGRPLQLPHGADRDAVRSGVQPQPDTGVGMRTTRIVPAAQESARNGRTVAC